MAPPIEEIPHWTHVVPKRVQGQEAASGQEEVSLSPGEENESPSSY